MQWPIFYKDELKLGDGAAGICTLWTNQKIFSQIDKKDYSVLGNLYTIQGINPMVKNIISKPKIRKIVLTGADLMKSGQALLNFMDKGIEKYGKIIDSSGYIDSNIPKAVIDNFRKNVEIIDMRGREKDIPETISKIKEEEPFMEPLFITELEKTTFPLKTKEPIFKLTGNTISEVWLKILDVVMKYGDEKETEYNIKTKEVIGVTAVISGDEEGNKFLDPSDIQNYYNTVFSAIKPKGIDYTYGERLFSFDDIDQIENVTDMLKKTPHTRRATAITWDVSKDMKSENPPCLTQIMWNVKDDKLYQTCVFRSHDMFGAWMLNAFAMRKLQNNIADKIGRKPGHLVILSNSAHIYSNNFKKAEEIVHDNYTGKMTRFEEDENGYFVLSLEDGEIVVQHHLKDGRKSAFVFRGKKAQVLYREIVHENLFSKFDHSAYIGHELARAERCLKTKEKYVQDEA